MTHKSELEPTIAAADNHASFEAEVVLLYQTAISSQAIGTHQHVTVVVGAGGGNRTRVTSLEG
jgi:hypothetical protein